MVCPLRGQTDKCDSTTLAQGWRRKSLRASILVLLHRYLLGSMVRLRPATGDRPLLLTVHFMQPGFQVFAYGGILRQANSAL
jgi:hypothetical protein